ncbi:2-dehydro-3-deoxyphosphogluconate aldolase / (4S)-4-hydroxy-2-oxoglutarate aldolase [Fictibacillus solisalsi]|uniref:2-dehydro-3-deoxyphosphogluconate aldolase / (4S)-4-hydroxy-2-oxoglutarate aldolase n=1 Tax=Fictibacillus solisalsi TaxID=459525 RepID=A0A1G9TDQ8_9BACL|nr:bifunctional 4-hydroxy-2-oxoglutarate aldolase/2-dehydro-3-deoxy-phosphogluconate aldolase [Fictibacillus solisalsi]SDM45787.1 2-dehydro-3-deoxyphosphogluconate aldolase / (4S)-4-hydroxy-2-oxoglutarate aldolase [Fictibacillus solisalsi]
MSDVLSSIKENKLVAIIRGAEPKSVLKIARALQAGGIRTLEITLNSPGALKVIEEVSSELGDELLVGAGTVLDPESARLAILAGAQFILAPTVNLKTIQMAKRYGAVSIPGAFTPTEILTAYEHGADIVKVFPASVGPSYIKDLRGPLPHIPLLPTGGVTLENVSEFMKAGAVGCGIGSALVNTKEEVTEAYLSRLTEKSRNFVKAVSQN